ncbi:DUF4340 domain-containing protein [uncultured Eubacterium sp.]|uniref:DUF4340 domain-containing protein n=1 Tax=uncultured Eubacterium sp. TaxID=165185 RepID=UPI0025F767DD|nr:DUF4340 domain-containing protein [uncultured Eubacterium sp.]
MRKKQWIILVIALVAIVAASAGMKGYQKKQDQKAAEQKENEKVYALQFASDDVTGISYEYDGTVLKFTKEGDDWRCSIDETAEIDADKMKTMLSSLGSMTADSTVESPEDVSEYGIDQPTQQVTLNFSDGSEKTVTFGSTNEIVGGTYVQVSDDENVYLVASSYVNTTLNKGVDDLKVDDTDDTDDTSSSSSETDTSSDTSTTTK